MQTYGVRASEPVGGRGVLVIGCRSGGEQANGGEAARYSRRAVVVAKVSNVASTGRLREDLGKIHDSGSRAESLGKDFVLGIRSVEEWSER